MQPPLFRTFFWADPSADVMYVSPMPRQKLLLRLLLTLSPPLSPKNRVAAHLKYFLARGLAEAAIGLQDAPGGRSNNMHILNIQKHFQVNTLC